MKHSLLIANPFFPPYAAGGAEYSLEQMCRRFSARRWSVHVIATCLDGRPRVEGRDGYRLTFVESPLNIEPGAKFNATTYLRSPLYAHRMRAAMLAAVEENTSGTILIANNGQCLEVVRDIRKITGCPAIGIVRDTQPICETGACIDNTPVDKAVPCAGYLDAGRCMVRFHQDRGVNGWRPVPGLFMRGMLNHQRRLRLRSSLREMNRVVAISDAIKLLLASMAIGVNPAVHVIRNFETDVEPSPDSEVRACLSRCGINDAPYFLFAGRKTYGKGADLLAEAARLLQSRGCGAKILMLGHSGLPLKQSDMLIDHPSVSQSLLLGLLQCSSGLIIPGRWQEGMNRTLIDALKHGIPVVCTNVGAPPIEGVQNGENGYVVPCEDVPSITNAIESILAWSESQHLRCKAFSMARFADRFDNVTILRQWEDLFGKIV